jgi:hypothetical protein
MPMKEGAISINKPTQILAALSSPNAYLVNKKYSYSIGLKKLGSITFLDFDLIAYFIYLA